MIGREKAWAILAVALVWPAAMAEAQEWTRFRGPGGQGISQEPTMPVKWTMQDYEWKADLPGKGHSSPVIWGERVFVTSGDQEANRLYILAFRASDGKELWRRDYAVSPFRMNRANSYATGSASVDADHVYVLLPTAEDTLLIALDHDGGEVWTSDFPGVDSQHGPGNTALAVGELVVFSHEQRGRDEGGGAQSAWIAVDRNTGKVRWTCERDSAQVSYSTPCVHTPEGGAPQLLFSSNAHGITGVDVETGKVVWEAKSAMPARVVSSPVIAGDLVIGTCGKGGGGVRLAAVRAGTGEEVYEATGAQAPYVSTGLFTDGLLFVYHDRGDVSCMVAATGEVLWSEKPGGRFWGSPVLVNGNLYCITREGDVVVIKASRTYELLAINPLGGESYATPAIAGGRMFLRTFSQLMAIEGTK
ncbi:MAG: PQQ-binding-like beta-propeller repeat protein [Candidatus Brocadiaceae bacterium]|jgi:outer membrane protein assembly factor BamB